MTTLTRAAYAREMGVSRSTVTRWVQDGRIHVDARGRIDPEAASRRLQATESPQPHHEARREQLAEARSRATSQKLPQPATPAAPSAEKRAARPAVATVAASAPLDAVEKIGLRHKLARMKREEMQASLAEMERDELAKQLLRRSDVEYVIDDIARTLANLADRVADRTAPALAGLAGDAAAIHSALAEAMRDLRTEFAGQVERSAGAWR